MKVTAHPKYFRGRSFFDGDIRAIRRLTPGLPSPLLGVTETGRSFMGNDLRSELDAAEKLIAAIQDLSLARDLGTVMEIVRRAARQLTGADGATFVLRDGTYCYYADEDAISPLWKGTRFPMATCISGWVMTHREPAVIPDIFGDPRIPVDAYRPTFVRSLAMVPIRVQAPIAAIGNYWARHHHATEQELKLLQALANSTSVAMENIDLCGDLERRVQSRTLELQAANRELEETNRELEAFAYSASHDLRAPLRAIKSFSEYLGTDEENRLSEDSVKYLGRINRAADRMNALIRDMLALAKVSTVTVAKQPMDIGALADEILRAFAADQPLRNVQVIVAPNGLASADPGLMRIVLDNLLSNAWKFTTHVPEARIEVGFTDRGDFREFFVKDNGAGFASEKAAQLFTPFNRLHAEAEFPGVGVGLATVRRIVAKHGGEVRAEGTVRGGATFFFTLPLAPAAGT
jgi:signal transduction histidine kinase